MKMPLLYTGVIFGILIVGVATLQGHIVMLALPLMAYLFAAIIQMPEAIRLHLSREITPEFAPQGTPLTVKLTVTNQGQAIDELIVQDILPHGIKLISGQTVQVCSLAPGGKIELEYTIEARRGSYTLYEVHVAARDFLGLFERSVVYTTRPRLSVHPRYPKLARVKIRPPQTRGFAGPIAARQAGTGVDFWGVREYQSGDPQRQINWKLAARSDQNLYTTIFNPCDPVRVWETCQSQ